MSLLVIKKLIIENEKVHQKVNQYLKSKLQFNLKLKFSLIFK